ncbi:MAG: HAD hydrolase family protein [Bacteroidota bacterium]
MNNLEIFRHIHTFIFDVDGVLTDSTVLITEEGKLLRRMNIRDGYAIKRAVEEGYRVVIISGGKNEGVRVRLQNLGVPDVYLGIRDKITTYEDVVNMYDLDEGGILYMGDDLPDYDIMRRVGLPACPADAAREITAVARYISPLNGGDGCARDVIEKVLLLNEQWNTREE